MNSEAASFISKAQRFSLTILLVGAMMLQFMQMASASHFSPDGSMDHSEHAVSHSVETHADISSDADDHHGHAAGCSMMLCQALSPLSSALPPYAIMLIADDFETLDLAMFDGPFVSQIGKPPKHI